MSTAANLLLVLDASMAMMEIQQKYMEVAQRAQLEGRDVNAEELQQLAQHNAEKRQQWDNLVK